MLVIKIKENKLKLYQLTVLILVLCSLFYFSERLDPELDFSKLNCYLLVSSPKGLLSSLEMKKNEKLFNFKFLFKEEAIDQTMVFFLLVNELIFITFSIFKFQIFHIPLGSNAPPKNYDLGQNKTFSLGILG